MVGTSTATCFPSCTALKAARTATSVLPKPTSPHTRRSIGRSASMSAVTSAMARAWSGVSVNPKASSKLPLPRCVGSEGVTLHQQPLLVQLDQLDGDLVDRGPRLGPGLAPFRAAQAVSEGASPPLYGVTRLSGPTAGTTCRRPGTRAAGSHGRPR